MKASKLTVYNHQHERKVAVRWIQKVARRSLPDVLKAATSPDAALLSLREVEVSIVSDEAIARVHGDFLDDPTPTDVITFHHGEIIVSADTAARQGGEHRQDTDMELALYVIHGLLHLAGWNDEDPGEQERMHRLQERILKAAAGACTE